MADTIEEGNSDQISRMVNLKDVQVSNTELAFVTAIDKENSTFFAQLCKFTNKQLIDHNTETHKLCNKISRSANNSDYVVKEAHDGDVFCTRYHVDNNWYRVSVGKCNNATKSCKAYFVDYGNFVDVSYEDLLQINPAELPTIEAPAFGFYCSLKDYESPAKELMPLHFLDSLLEEYILMKVMERLGPQHWRVRLPKNAYNSAFWISYQLRRSEFT